MWQPVGLWGLGAHPRPEAGPTWTPWKKKRSDDCHAGAAAQKLLLTLILGMVAAAATPKLLLLQLWLILARAGGHSQAALQLPADAAVLPLVLPVIVPQVWIQYSLLQLGLCQPRPHGQQHLPGLAPRLCRPHPHSQYRLPGVTQRVLQRLSCQT